MPQTVKNKLLTVQLIALHMMDVLEEIFVAKDIVHFDATNEYFTEQNVGDTVNVKIPAEFEAHEFKDKIVVQGINEGKIPVVMDTHLDVSVPYTTKEETLSITNFMGNHGRNMVKGLVRKIEKMIIHRTAESAALAVGSPTAAPSADIVADVMQVLTEGLIPEEDRNGFLSPRMVRDIRVGASNVSHVGTDATLRTGALLPLYGAGLYQSQNTPIIDPGAFAALNDVTITGAEGSRTVTLTSAAGVSTDKLNAGAQIKISGEAYAVVKGAQAIAGVVTVEIAPALGLDADHVPVSFVTSQKHVANTIVQKNSFVVVHRPFALPAGLAPGLGHVVWSDVLGLGIRVCKGYDLVTKTNLISVDCLFGTQVLRPRGICRIMGKAS